MLGAGRDDSTVGLQAVLERLDGDFFALEVAQELLNSSMHLYLHVAPCPVTRSLHLSRVNIMIGDWGVLEEIVEEELPLVIVIAAVLGSYRTVTHF